MLKIAALVERAGPKIKSLDPVVTGGFPRVATIMGKCLFVGWTDITEGRFDASQLRDYDMVWMEWGWTPKCAQAAIAVREHCPKVKIAIFDGCLDRWWEKCEARHLAQHFAAAQACDAICCMYEGARRFYEPVFGKPAVYMPVPVNVDAMRKYRLPRSERAAPPRLLLGQHMGWVVDNRSTIAHAAVLRRLEALRSGRKQPKVQATGYANKDAPETVVAGLASLGFDGIQIERPCDNATFSQQACQAMASVSTTSRMVMAQWSVEAAALGVPVVSAEHLEAHKRLWPTLSFPWYDVESMAIATARLLDDPEWWTEACEYADAELVRYSDAACRQRVESLL